MTTVEIKMVQSRSSGSNLVTVRHAIRSCEELRLPSGMLQAADKPEHLTRGDFAAIPPPAQIRKVLAMQVAQHAESLPAEYMLQPRGEVQAGNIQTPRRRRDGNVILQSAAPRQFGTFGGDLPSQRTLAPRTKPVTFEPRARQWFRSARLAIDPPVTLRHIHKSPDKNGR